MSRNRLISMILVMGFVCWSGGSAWADTVQLKNGDVLTGKVTKFDAKALHLSTSYAGDISIDAAEVDRVSTDEPVVVEMGDGRELAGRLVTDTDGGMSVATDAGAPVPVALSQVSTFAPPEPWFRYEGEVYVGLNGASGNTKTQGYHLAALVRPEFGKNAITFEGQLNRSEAEIDGTDETTESNWRVLGQYDRFLTDHWYLFINNGWENDDLKDLNVRISAATGAGYKFWDDEMRFLTAELGPGFIYENFQRVFIEGDPLDVTDDRVENPDRDYITARWALDFDHGIFDPSARFYHNHILQARVDNLDTFLFQSGTGLKFALIGNFTAGAEVQFDWNNDPARGAKENDLRYLLRLGYSF